MTPAFEVRRHAGASFQPGSDLVHLWWTGLGLPRLGPVWRRLLVDEGLAVPLEVESQGDQHRAWAPCYPFLPLPLVRRVAEASLRSSPPATLRRDLAPYAYDADAYRGAFGLHRAEALSRGWPAWPLLLGSMPSLILGCGRFHRVVPMNMAPSTSPTLAQGGMNKAVGRDLLKAYGLPVAPGGMARSPSEAVARALPLGWPVVLKRLIGGNSDGVITGIHDEASCLAAARLLTRGDQPILVEKEIAGLELRVHVVAGRIREIVRRQRVLARANGKSTLRELVEPRYTLLLRMARRSPWIRQKLVYRFWAHGARRFADLARIVPPKGTQLVVGLGFVPPTRGRGLGDMHASDRRRIDAFLTRQGSPSGALDLILREAGARLSDGGAILEINVPSGFWYLADPQAVVKDELDHWAASEPGFQDSSGRVPVWLAAVEHPGGAVPRSVRSNFLSEFPTGSVAMLEGENPWPAILTLDADAILLPVSDADVEAHGLPMNLAPTVCHGLPSAAAFAEAYPRLSVAIGHAGPGVSVRGPG